MQQPGGFWLELKSPFPYKIAEENPTIMKRLPPRSTHCKAPQNIGIMAQRDDDPLQQLCRGLQTHWMQAARNASAFHSFCGGQLRHVLISSGMAHPRSRPSPTHFHRR